MGDFIGCTSSFGSHLAVGNLQGPKEEVLDENEWWAKLEKLKVALDQQEVVIKRNFGRNGADILEDLHTGLVFTCKSCKSCRRNLCPNHVFTSGMSQMA